MKVLNGSSVLNRGNNVHSHVFAKMKAHNKVKMDKESSKLGSQGRANTIASRRGYMSNTPMLHRDSRPLGNRMTVGTPSREATTNIWAMEGNNKTAQVRTYGRVVRPSNHPNQRLNKIYG